MLFTDKMHKGKTNLLESMWILPVDIHLEEQKDSELIAFGKTTFEMNMKFLAKKENNTQKSTLTNGRRSITINDIPKNQLLLW